MLAAPPPSDCWRDSSRKRGSRHRPHGWPQTSTGCSRTIPAGVAVVTDDGRSVGVITVTTMLYVGWGRLAEIGDLYVMPDHRGRGLARRLVAAAVDWAGRRGCSGTYVTLTPDGEARHQLSRFYAKLDFQPTGRTTMMCVTHP